MRTKPLLIGFAFALAGQALATEFIATNLYAIAKERTVADEQWVLAERAQPFGTFQNDLFIATGTPLPLEGAYEGNLWAAGGMDTVFAGTCARNVRLAGQTVRIDGVIGGNLLALADTIIVGTNATIHGSARLVGTSIVQEGAIGGNVHITAARIATLGGRIGGNATVVAQDILFSREARIEGNLAYTAAKEIVPTGDVVGGRMERVIPLAEPLFSPERLTGKAMGLLAAILAGVPFIALFPMTTAMSTQLARRAPWKCLLVGIAASVALPFFGIMAVSSIIGIPLGILILTAWAIMIYLSKIVMGLLVGTLILRSVGTSIGRVVLAMALGLAAIHLVSLVPSIGVPIQLMVVWLGMGALILALLEKRRLIIQVPQNLKLMEALKNKPHNPEEKTP